VGLTGLTGPRGVRIQLEIFIGLDLVIGFLAGQVHPPYKYKGPRPIEESNRSKTHQYITFLYVYCLYIYLQTLAPSNPNLLFFLRLRDV
jgi:hypothetical protein